MHTVSIATPHVHVHVYTPIGHNLPVHVHMPTSASLPAHVSLHACVVNEQSYYIVHCIRRKEEGKKEERKRTNTDNLQQPQRLRKMYMYVYALPASAA